MINILSEIQVPGKWNCQFLIYKNPSALFFSTSAVLNLTFWETCSGPSSLFCVSKGQNSSTQQKLGSSYEKLLQAECWEGCGRTSSPDPKNMWTGWVMHPSKSIDLVQCSMARNYRLCSISRQCRGWTWSIQPSRIWWKRSFNPTDPPQCCLHLEVKSHSAKASLLGDDQLKFSHFHHPNIQDIWSKVRCLHPKVDNWPLA